TSKFDLTLSGIEIGGQLIFSFGYCTKLFHKTTISKFADYFQAITAAVANEPGGKLAGFEIISPEEKKRVLYQYNTAETGYPKAKTIHKLFAEQVKRTPDQIALIGQIPKGVAPPAYKEGTGGLAPLYITYYITYRELNEKADRLAHALKGKGVRPDTIVGIMTERSIYMVTGLLAILKSGGAYLPIDPGYPEERISYMLADSGVRILLTDLAKGMMYEKSIVRIPDAINRVPTMTSRAAVVPTMTSHHLCYVIYTSGTTGKPKGVLVEHRGLVNFITWRLSAYRH
ncbi:MAG: AMP-binding protein, partial [bacterium]|nr:AMP-binding protein [bacterium]